MAAIIECDIESVRKSLYTEIPKLETARKEIEGEIAKEELGQINLTVPQIKFFLSVLKRGNVNDIKYRKTLVNIFVNAIYLYGGKISLVFNSGDVPVTVDIDTLNWVDEQNKAFECSFLGSVAPPK